MVTSSLGNLTPLAFADLLLKVLIIPLTLYVKNLYVNNQTLNAAFLKAKA